MTKREMELACLERDLLAADDAGRNALRESKRWEGVFKFWLGRSNELQAAIGKIKDRRGTSRKP